MGVPSLDGLTAVAVLVKPEGTPRSSSRPRSTTSGYIPPARPPDGAAEDEQLLAEDEEFEIAIGTRSTTDDEEIDQQAEEGVQEGQQHRAASVGPPVLPVKPPTVACPRVSARLGDLGSGRRSPPRQLRGSQGKADPPEPADE